jgi:hypothetical protein
MGKCFVQISAGHTSKQIFQPLSVVLLLYRVDHKVVPLGANKKTFFVIARFSKNVIPPKFTGVPITQPEKIFLM